MILRLLIRIGFVRRKHDGKIRWPFTVPPLHVFSSWRTFVAWCRWHGWKPYVFRNLPGVVKWIPGRLLPRRWGIGWCGFEFGDRG